MQHYLLTPGPTLLPREVLAASSRQMIYHREAEFGSMLAEILGDLRRVFNTCNPILPFTASGTGGVEATIVNLCSPGDSVIVVRNGAFGDLLTAVAEAYRVHVIKVDLPWGDPIDPDAVLNAVQSAPEARAVMVVHNETSTGVRSDLAAIGNALRGQRPLLVVDAVSSAGAIEIRADDWGLDVVIAASQKALMAPPGIALVSVSERAWEATRAARLPRYYWSFARMRGELGDALAFTPSTPAISVLYALRAGLKLLMSEGLEERFARHRRIARAVRTGVRALGLRVMASEEVASETVTTILLPEGVDDQALLQRLREDHGVILASGQGRLKGKVVRFGHMGWISEDVVLIGLRALEAALPCVGWSGYSGAEAAAREVLVG